MNGLHGFGVALASLLLSSCEESYVPDAESVAVGMAAIVDECGDLVGTESKCDWVSGAPNHCGASQTTVMSLKSGTADDAPTSATCQAGFTLTGCSCYSPWKSCDGAMSTGNTCTAYNMSGGLGVFAQAVCITIPSLLGATEISSSLSGTSSNAVATSSCPAGYVLTGCTCYSPWASCDGAKASVNTCTAYNEAGGNGVYAQARCVKASGITEHGQTVSELSKSADDAPTSAICGSGWRLTGCSCYSPDASCDGAKATGSTCVAYNMSGGLGVYAQAQCVRFEDLPRPTYTADVSAAIAFQPPVSYEGLFQTRANSFVQGHITYPYPDPYPELPDPPPQPGDNVTCLGYVSFALANLYASNQCEGRTALEDLWGPAGSSPCNIPPDDSYDEGDALNNGEPACLMYFFMPYLLRSYFNPEANQSLSDRHRRIIEDFLWRWVYRRSKFVEASGSEWRVFGSENHNLMATSSHLLALQALRRVAGPNATLHDGHTIDEHYNAWVDHWRRYLRSAAREGLSIEVGAYSKYTVSAIQGVFDFTEDSTLRRLAWNYLTLYWADIAQDYLPVTGIRGGALNRTYQGDIPEGNGTGLAPYYTIYGLHPSYERDLSRDLVAPTSSYRVPDVVANLAKDVWKPSFAYTSRRFGRGDFEPDPSGYFDVDLPAGNSDVSRYSYHTPQYVLGTMATLFSAEYQRGYTDMLVQNQAMGVHFSAGSNSRVIVFGAGKTGNYSQMDLQGIARRGAMLIARGPNAYHSTDTGVFLSTDISSRSVKNGSWLISRSGGSDAECASTNLCAYVGIRFAVGGHSPIPTVPPGISGITIFPDDEWSPIVIQVAPVSQYVSLSAFGTALNSRPFSYGPVSAPCSSSSRAQYTSFDGDVLAVWRATLVCPPRANGAIENLNPTKTFNSPYISATHPSDIVSINYGGTSLNLDFSY